MEENNLVKNPFTGEENCMKIKVPCNCDCHKSGNKIMHFMSCCDGNQQVTLYVDKDKFDKEYNKLYGRL